MDIRLVGCFGAMLLSFITSIHAEEPHWPEQEEMLEQRLQRMQGSVELLRQADQPDLASEVAKHAEAVARQLREVHERRFESSRLRERPEPRQPDLERMHMELIERLDGMREQVMMLRREVAELRGELEEQRRRDSEAKFGRLDLSGRWMMTLPAGFEHETQISSRGDGLYSVEVRGNLRGLYRHRGNRLTMEIPGERRLTEFAWEIRSEDMLLLTESPPSGKVGADYRGATLRRIPGEVLKPELQKPVGYEPPAYETEQLDVAQEAFAE